MDKEEFLNKHVFGWIKRDFERMLSEVKPIPYGEGNINFFLAFCALSVVEFLGSLLLGEDKKFEENAREYISRCFDKPEEYPIEILRDFFRNGLAHEFFPRGAVSRDNKRPAIVYDDDIGIILDAETLVNDLLQSLDKFKTKLDDDKYEKIIKEIRLKIKKFQTKYKDLVDKLPKRKKNLGFESNPAPSRPCPESSPDPTSISTSSTSVSSVSPTTSKDDGKSFISTPPPVD